MGYAGSKQQGQARQTSETARPFGPTLAVDQVVPEQERRLDENIERLPS
jgi:hypothetical protein